ncbi:hypothetical protein J6590_049815 [Homalodisca vitripennis]|nr:hypothetical protein J6590_049815 [Homalodisca vitripennis]
MLFLLLNPAVVAVGHSDPHVTFVICLDYTKILIFPAFRIPACLPTHYNSGQFCSVSARLVSGIDTCGSPTSAPFRATERVVLDENRILQALQEDVESDVETGAETDVGSDVDEIEEREDDACRNSDTEQSDEDSENDGPDIT